MPLDLCDYERQARLAVEAFWGSRDAAAQAQADKGTKDAGSRGAVTAGKNMDGFLGLLSDIVRRNGLPNADIHLTKGVVVLPGFFRPTKQWDVVVMNGPTLVAVLELKSQVGPSFGNNFNNRCEEAIGSAQDVLTAYRENAFGDDVPRPFLGWLVHLHECHGAAVCVCTDKKKPRKNCPGSMKPIGVDEPHFPVMADFRSSPSYAKRYEIMCRKLMQEQLYDAACLLVSERTARDSGAYRELSGLTSLKTLVSGLAAHVAAVSA